MITDAALRFAPAVSAIIAAIAAAVSAWNAGKSSQNADRQHGLAYAGDIARWGADVLKVLPRIAIMYRLQTPRQERFDAAVVIGNDLISLFDQSAFLFPTSDSEASQVLQDMIDKVVLDNKALKDRDLISEENNSYSELRTRFTQAVRNSIRVSKRYADAQKYLS